MSLSLLLCGALTGCSEVAEPYPGYPDGSALLSDETLRARPGGPIDRSIDSSTVDLEALSKDLPPGLTLRPAYAVAEAYTAIRAYGFLYRGVEIEARSGILIIDDRDQRSIRRRQVPKSLPEVQPRVPADEALAVAVADLRARVGPPIHAPKVAAPKLEILVDSDLRGHLSWSFDLRAAPSGEPSVGYRYWIAADRPPTVLEAQKTTYHGQGIVVADVWATTPRSSRVQRPLSGLTVDVTGGTPSSSEKVVTGAGGRFTWAASSVSLARIGVFGPDFSVFTVAKPSSFTTAPNPDLRTVDLTRLSAPVEVTTVAHWLGWFTRFANPYLSSTSCPAVKASVGLDLPCNAAYDRLNHAVQFGKDSGDCVATAYGDWILHELGHHLDQCFKGIRDGALTEGTSDALVVLITGQALFGRDFRGPGSSARDAATSMGWVTAVNSKASMHQLGSVFAGFVWKALEILRQSSLSAPPDASGLQPAEAALARLLMLTVAADPKSIPEAACTMMRLAWPTGPPDPARTDAVFEALKAAAADSGLEVWKPRDKCS